MGYCCDTDHLLFDGLVVCYRPHKLTTEEGGCNDFEIGRKGEEA